MGRGRRLSPGQLLENGATAFVILDRDHRISLISRGMQELAGWSADELLELKCDRAAPAASSGTSLEILCSALAAPAVCWSGDIVHERAVLPHRDGRILQLELSFIPLRSPDGEIAGILISAASKASFPPESPRPALTRSLHAEINALRLDMKKRFSTVTLAGSSPAVVRALRQADCVAQTGCGFTITGPEGSGRQHLARLIHARSTMSASSLAILDCSLLSPSALLATLKQLQDSGHAVSGMSYQTAGMLLLVNADRMPQETQARLLLSNPHGKLTFRIGATAEFSLTAYPKLLLPELAELLTTMEIHLPPLHNRGDDILLLSEQFIQESRRDHQTSAERLSADVRRQFLDYRWPGQVRELRTVVSAACLQCRRAEIHVEDLPFGFRIGQDAQRYSIQPPRTISSLEDAVQQYERELIERTLAECLGNKAEAARRLQLTRPRLYRRMAALGMDPDDPAEQLRDQ